MGWARTLLLGDIGNRLDIADAERDIDSVRAQLRAARRHADSLDARVARLEQDAEEVEFFVGLLLKRLEKAGLISPEEVEQLVRVVDPDVA